jgi:ribosomal protein L11 methyltransferase
MADDMSGERTWAEIELRVADELAGSVSNRLIEEGANGVVLLDDDFFWDEEGNRQQSEPGVTTVKTYFPAEAMLDVRSSLESYLRSLKEIYPHAPTPEIQVRNMPGEDWAHSWRRFFKPIEVAKGIVIKPTWETYKAKADELVIELDPGMAFGTGQHATTRLCIDAIRRHVWRDEPSGARRLARNALDVGTGSGILAILLAKLGVAHTVAIDVEAASIEATKENAKLNGVLAKLELRKATIQRIPGTFDLVVANILAEVIVNMREELVAHVEKGGVLILSGILKQKGADVKRAFQRGEVEFIESFNDEDWTSLVFQKI